MRVDSAINQACLELKKNKIQSPLLDSEILMSKAIKKKREYVLLNLEKEINQNIYDYYKKLVRERSKGKPIAYILGKKAFWKYEFEINQNVLIPRPDTELIISAVLELTKKKKDLKVLDIGIGSGCILLTLLKERKNLRGVGIDISKKCIDISRINAKNLKVYERVKFFKSDVDNFNIGKYDVIVSNPPYIKKHLIKYLKTDVSRFEPKLALNGGLNGISSIEKVINRTSKLIKKNGIFILEIAFDQKKVVTDLLIKRGFFIKKILKDYAKNDRCIICTKIN